ncbi:MAG TPA: hypothetical protein VML96_04615 [Egibacteraceae bacterium]|nr:hypothetical protein [Egibacteraceae bacterium]
MTRKVQLRAERSGLDRRNLWAWVDASGDLHLDGQDLGPSTAFVSDDGEYEWERTIAAVDVPRLIELLGGQTGADVLDLLEQRYSGEESYELERLLRESDVPSKFARW